MKHQIELKEHELRLLDERIADSTHAQLEREVIAAEKQFRDDQELLVAKKEAIGQLTKDIKSLEADITNLKQSRQSKIGVLEKRFAESKKEAQKLDSQLKKAQQQLSELVLEAESAEQELASNSESVSGIQKEIENLRREEKKLEEKLSDVQGAYDEANQQLEKRRTNLTMYDQQLKELSVRQSELSKKRTVLQLERKKTEHKISRLVKDESDAKVMVKKLEKAHPWIETEKEFFGREHTDYDFQRRDPASANHRLLELKETQGALSKKINKKVMGMIEKAEQEYQGLMNKRHIIENDKEKITSVIKELDTKKNEALETTWVKVTKDFGSIFSTLLPGTTAKLDPPANGASLNLHLGADLASELTVFVFHRHDSGWPAGSRRLRRRVEGEPDGVEWRPTVSPGTLADPFTAAVQARSHVHPGRGGRRAGPFTHAEHRPDDPVALFALAVHRGVAQGGHVQQRERGLPDQVRRRRLHRHAHRAFQGKVDQQRHRETTFAFGASFVMA